MIKLKNLLFESEPIVAHCPGPLHENWEFFAEEVFAATPQSRSSRESAIFLTWHGPDRAEKPNGILERCAARHGCEFVVLRHGGANWTNARKLAMTAEALEKTDAEFVVGLDSCDVLLVDHPDEIVRRFRTHFACDLLFNATGSACWPELPEFVMFESSLPGARNAHGRCWLNSGAFVGRTSFCRKYFRTLADFATANGYENDQTVAKANWPRFYPSVQIDDRCDIFQWFNESCDYLRFVRSVDSAFRDAVWDVARFGNDANIHGVLVGFGDSALPEHLFDVSSKLRLWFVESWRSAKSEGRSTQERSRRKFLWRTAHAASRRHEVLRHSLEACRLFPSKSLDFVLIETSVLPERGTPEVEAWTRTVSNRGFIQTLKSSASEHGFIESEDSFPLDSAERESPPPLAY